MTPTLIALLLFTGPQAAASAPAPAPALEYIDAKRLATADEAGVTGTAHADMVAKQGALLDAGIAACAHDNLRDDFTPFTIVMRLDASGTVTETWRNGTSPLGICIQRYVRGKVVFVPPKAPFYNMLEVSFTK